MKQEAFLAAVSAAVSASPKDGSKWKQLEQYFSDEGLRGNGALNNSGGADRRTRSRQLGTAKAHAGQTEQGVAQHSVYVMGGETLDSLDRDKDAYLAALRGDLESDHPGFESVLVVRADSEGALLPLRLFKRPEVEGPAHSYIDWWPELAVEVCPPKPKDDGSEPPPSIDFTDEDLLRDAFIPEDELKGIVSLLEARRNVILQGPPGVGKSFLAKRIAFAAMGTPSLSRMHWLQFHAAYSYEELIEGYRPSQPEDSTGFTLAPGSLKHFVEVASSYGDEPCVLVLDEINRANLSAVLGEAMTLIERDKRGERHAIRTMYSREPLFLPENLLILGLMNTADRSIALVDYALRRRFAFVDLPPRFNKLFEQHLLNRGISEEVVRHLFDQIATVNLAIRESSISLGRGFEIGHSYFCGGPDLSAMDSESRTKASWQWLREIIRYDVAPLLREYWFDDRDSRAKMIGLLYGEELPEALQAELFD